MPQPYSYLSSLSIAGIETTKISLPSPIQFLLIKLNGSGGGVAFI